MKVVCNGSAGLNCWKRKGDIVDKTILLKNASLLTEDAKCVQNQNLYVRDGKILKILDASKDSGEIPAERDH